MAKRFVAAQPFMFECKLTRPGYFFNGSIKITKGHHPKHLTDPSDGDTIQKHGNQNRCHMDSFLFLLAFGCLSRMDHPLLWRDYHGVSMVYLQLQTPFHDQE